MSLSLGFLVLDIATVVCAVLLGARVLANRPLRTSALLIAAIMACSICDVVLGRQDYQYWIPPALHFALGAPTALFNLARNVTTSLFMVLCFALFAGKRTFPRWLAALVAVQLALEYPLRSVLPDALTGHRFWTDVAPAALQALFACVALYWTLARWRDDLSETRRRIRLLTSAVIALNLVVSDLLTRVLIGPETIANYYAHEALIASHLAILLFVLFQLSEGNIAFLLGPMEAAAAPVRPKRLMEPETAAALVRLTKLLEEERVYRKAGLSLKALADLAGLPEYRLRRLIHEELGHQNFNAFLHQYRIAEACIRLRDPGERRIPILTIALSVGYQSINTFNRGFREVMETTPSAYRARAESAEAAPGKVAPETA